MKSSPEVVDARPPNFAAILAVFPQAADPGVIFAYGGKVYAPGNTKLTRELLAHEAVHLQRQGDNPDAWWARYLTDEMFRFEEERLAHVAEYRTYCKRHIAPEKRAKALKTIAGRLAGTLYGFDVPRNTAELMVQFDYNAFEPS